MEDKKINEQESLALIQNMLIQTRRNVVRGGAFLWMGYPLMVGFAVLALLTALFKQEFCYYAVWGFTVAMTLISALAFKRGWISFGDKCGMVGYSEKILTGIWKTALSVIAMILLLFTLHMDSPTGLTNMMGCILLILVMAFWLSRELLEDKIFAPTYCSAALGFLSSLIQQSLSSSPDRMYRSLFLMCIGYAISMLFLLVIPGHKLRNRAKKEAEALKQSDTSSL